LMPLVSALSLPDNVAEPQFPNRTIALNEASAVRTHGDYGPVTHI